MLQKVILPQLGQTMEEGTIEKWHKKEGDTVSKGDVLFDLTTDKATLEVEAFAEGILKVILVEEGATVPVNDLVAIVGDEQDKVPEDLSSLAEEDGESDDSALLDGDGSSEDDIAEKQKATAGASGKAQTVESPDAGTGVSPQQTERLFISPRARKIAEENHVAAEALRGRGSGPDGRIVEKDVRKYLKLLDAGDVKYTPAAKEVAFAEGLDILTVEPEDAVRITKKDVLNAKDKGKDVLQGETVELNAMRKTIAQRMTHSKQNIPHFYLVGDVHMSSALDMRKELNESGEDQHITITDMIIKTAAIALEKHPRMNASFDNNTLIVKKEINIGVAVAVDDGLFVPVIHNAAEKSLYEISTELKSLAKKSREGTLLPEQYEGGCVTISNLGAYGIDYFLPIINPPESCIIGIGAVKEEIVVKDGNMRIEPVMKVSVSADHRVTDGAAAADFFKTFCEILKSPKHLIKKT